MPMVLGGGPQERHMVKCLGVLGRLPMMFARHPEVASRIVQQLEGHPDSPFLVVAASSDRALSGTMGFEPTS